MNHGRADSVLRREEWCPVLLVFRLAGELYLRRGGLEFGMMVSAYVAHSSWRKDGRLAQRFAVASVLDLHTSCLEGLTGKRHVR